MLKAKQSFGQNNVGGLNRFYSRLCLSFLNPIFIFNLVFLNAYPNIPEAYVFSDANYGRFPNKS